MKRLYKRFLGFVERYWVGTLLLVGTTALVSVPLWFRLGSLTGGLSVAEMQLRMQTIADQISLHGILHDPFFLLYKLGLYILQFIPLHGGASLRSISALLGLAGIIGFYWIVRIWYTRRLAVLATILFASSSWLLHLARYASIDSSYLFLFVILAAWTWVKRGSYNRLAFVFALFMTIIGLYIPGFIWFIIPAVIWQRKTIRAALRKLPLPILIPSVLFGLALLVPLAVSLIAPSPHVTTLSNVRELLGLPNDLPTIRHFISNLLTIPLQVLVISPSNSLLSVGRLPLLDIFTSAMVLIGAIHLGFNYKLDRSKIIFTILIIGSLLIALGGPVHISLLLPFLYLMAAEGIGYLLKEWLTIFPRNPYARSLGVVVISLAVAVSCTFQLASYFIAWPHTDIVKSSFTQHP